MSLKHAGSHMGKCTQIYILRDLLFGAEHHSKYQVQLASYVQKIWQRITNIWQVTWRWVHNVSGTSCKLLDEDVKTYQEHLASYLECNVTTYEERLESYLKKMLQCSWIVLQVTWRRYDSVSGKPGRLLEEDVTTYQERLASYLNVMLQRMRNVLQVTWRLFDNVSGTSGKLLEDEFTTSQERLASYLTKMLKRIRIIWQVTWRCFFPWINRGTRCSGCWACNLSQFAQ